MGVMQTSQKVSAKEKLFSVYRNFKLPDWTALLLLLGLAIVGFGLFIPNLGFYMDDWHFVHYAYTRGLDSLNDVLLYDSRPYGAWLYIMLFRLLGFKPLAWHLAALILRVTTTVIFLFFFWSLWSQHRREAFYVSLLFLIYPFFLLQPMSVAYSLHWVGFLCYALSLWLMVLAFQKETKAVFLFMAIALLLEGVHLFASEYFSGLEFLRPFVIWILIARRENRIAKRALQTFLAWLPYLFVLAGYFIWRFVIFQGPPQGARNSPELIYQFLAIPLKTAIGLSITALKDASIILFGSWHEALAPEVFELRSFFTRTAFFIIVLSFLAAAFILNRIRWESTTVKEAVFAAKWRVEAAFLGVVALLTGILPMWVIGKSISTHKNQMAATRFGFASTLGAAILLMLLIEYFITERKKANIAIALLLSLAIGVHLRNANIYEYSWEKQKNLYQQLVQRVPDMLPNTAVISAEEVLPYMGDYPTSYALNSIYPSSPEETPYWFFAIYSNFPDQIDSFLEGMPLEEEHLLSNFSGHSKESLYISYEPGRGQCLWVLRPEDVDLRLLSDLERQASLNSALDRIQIEQKERKTLPISIFGEEVPQNWCSYYQRADLARQRENWQEIVSLWEEAQAIDKHPENGFEYIPFIEGYAHEGQWREVKQLTRNANKVSQGMAPILCTTLIRVEGQTSGSAERDVIMTDLFNDLGCDIKELSGG